MSSTQAYEEVHDRILEVLKKSEFGTSTSEIASVLGLNRMTVSKHLELLRAQGFVDYRQVGPAKLWYLSDEYSKAIHMLKDIESPYIQKLLNDEESGSLRPRLGDQIPLHVFRLTRAALVMMSGADDIMYKMGREISMEILSENIDAEDIRGIYDGVADFFEKLKIGILELVSSSEDRAIIRIYECITCSGMPNIGRPICYFEGGLMSGAFEAKMNKTFTAIEMKCGGTGHEYCEFDVRHVKK